jgi:signal peptidase II
MQTEISRKDAKKAKSAKLARNWGYLLAAGVCLLDRLTKYIIEGGVSEWDNYTVIPGFFSIIRTHNRGAAFSLFSSADPRWTAYLLAGLSLVAVVLITTLLWGPSQGSLADSGRMRFALSLILGGAAGNLYDRLAHGAVTDFLDLHLGGFHWPAFNLADSAITIGAALALLDLLRARRSTQRT